MSFPNRGDYQRVVDGLANYAVQNDLCFFLYGSFIRDEDFVPGRSDVDGGFILGGEFLTDRQEVESLAWHFKRTVGYSDGFERGMSVNLNLMDRGINKDGRFLAYDNTYADYLKTNALVFGPNFLREMNGINFKLDALRSAAHNLRGVRNGILTYFLDLRENKNRAERTIIASMETLSSMPKKLLEVKGLPLEFENGAFFQKFMLEFPEYDPEIYERVSSLRRNPHNYFSVLSNSIRAFDSALDFLNATENMVKIYVSRNPKPTRLEVAS